jgi:adenosine/AMP kinase
MEFSIISIEKPDEFNFILGQTHFIKTVEDIYETLVTAVPNIKFGLAFCEASGKRLLRTSGTDQDLIDLARKNALAIGAGHSFILFLGEGYFPINVLNAIKMGRGILGVVDGFSPQGVEVEEDVVWRKDFLRTIGYKV